MRVRIDIFDIDEAGLLALENWLDARLGREDGFAVQVDVDDTSPSDAG